MSNEPEYVGQIFQRNGIEFVFPNLKNLAASKITYPQFLACVAQRLLLKQYSANVMDTKNIMCSQKKVTEIFDENKDSFSSGINNLFLKPTTLSMINLQASKNKITKKEQSEAAAEIVKWYESFWFDRLKSEEMLETLENLFSDAQVPQIKSVSGDWEILKELYGSYEGKDFFDMIGSNSQIFINTYDSIPAQTFDDILESCYKFMKFSGSVDIPRFKDIASKGDLIVATTSAFMLSTISGINEVENKQKNYISMFEPYNMFRLLSGTSMSNILKMNQMLFTTYKYFKILL